MIQFDFNRFGRVARWSLRNDRRYFVKSFLQMFVILLLGFLLFLTANTSNNHSGGLLMCSIMILAIFQVTIVLGSSYMFFSMDGKHNMQTLLMLPASNLEKYLMRYATWLILLPLYLVAFVAADLLQYAVNTLIGREDVMLVMQYMADMIDIGEFLGTKANGNTAEVVFHQLMLTLWLHSLYAVGATFFRSRKYNWVVTTVVLILGFMLLTTTVGWGNVMVAWWNNRMLWSWVFLMLTLFNFWLSYRLFCRTQVIGKFINV